MENACAAAGARADCPAGGLADETGWTWPGTGSKHGPPESEGFSLERLEPLRELSEDPSARRYDGPIAGSVVFEYGNAKLASKIASVRQSMLSLVSAVEMAEEVSGSIGTKPWRSWTFEDKPSFIVWEKHAGLEQLLSCTASTDIGQS